MNKKKMISLFYFIIILSAANNLSAQSRELAEINVKPKVYAVQINVTDMDKAIEFYKELGFDVITKDYYPRVVPIINGKTMIPLHKVDKITPTNPKGARTTLNVIVKKLDSKISELEKKGIKIIHKTPQKAAVGIWKAIQDPFGNIVNLIENENYQGNLERPKVQNVSIVVTDMDKALDFYDNLLGFDILSVKYYPPVVPLKTEGAISNIALHQSAEKLASKEYPDGTQTFLVIKVDNLASAMNYLKDKGVEFIHNTPQQAAIGIYAAFKDPFGLIHELVELKSP